MTAILVANQSTVVSDTDVKAMTRAVAYQVRHHAAPAWGLDPIPVMYTSTIKDAQPGMWVISVLDDSDQADALGWHTEEQGDLIYGRVFAKPVLDNGGDALHKPLSVASVLSHEAIETLCDPRVNSWFDNGHGVLIAGEACDAVESDSYTIPVYGHGDITVSNFVLPTWFDPYSNGPYDYLHKVPHPFTMTRGGYWVQMQGGQTSQKFGEEFPEWKKAIKSNVDTVGRGARRIEA